MPHVLTALSNPIHQFLQEQNHEFIRRRGRTLSTAKITRAVLAGCAEAGVSFGALQGPEEITAFVAAALAQHKTQA